MSRKFLPVLFYSLFVSIVIPGISHALNGNVTLILLPKTIYTDQAVMKNENKLIFFILIIF
jgi:hypothetical protein